MVNIFLCGLEMRNILDTLEAPVDDIRMINHNMRLMIQHSATCTEK